jgi:hypothetical protein
MTIKEIQDGVINQIGHLYDGSDSEYNDAPLFAYDIRKCNTPFEFIVTLGQYGYTRESALDILGNVIATSNNQINKDMTDETNELKMKLEIVKSNISDLVDYLDENRLMESTPDQVWKCILAIEKVVGLDKFESEQFLDGWVVL